MIEIQRFAEFSAAVNSQLLAAVRDAHSDSIQHLTENPNDLYRLLAVAIRTYKIPANFHFVEVDYDQPIKSAAEDAGFKGEQRGLSCHWGKRTLKGRVRIEVAVICLKESFKFDEVISRLALMKFRPANLWELLASARPGNHLNIENKPIYGVGTVGYKKVPASFNNPARQVKVVGFISLNCYYFKGGSSRCHRIFDSREVNPDYHFPKDARFAVVRVR
jgi:hypothetical protein